MPSSKSALGSERLDTLLVSQGLVETRSRAQALVLAGAVRVGGEVVTKAGSRFASDAELYVEGGSPYVSRAGEKLAGALDDFGVEVASRECLDAGASTGGFTDVLLQRGASRVISADVGYGQLDWRLRNDSRVSVMERTNLRHITAEGLPLQPDLLVADLSFISLPVALESIISTSASLQEMVLLVKPQFEAGREHVGRGGVVSDPQARAGAIHRVIEALSPLGFGAVGISRSAISGRRSGNREYPLRLLRGAEGSLTAERVREEVCE